MQLIEREREKDSLSHEKLYINFLIYITRSWQCCHEINFYTMYI